MELKINFLPDNRVPIYNFKNSTVICCFWPVYCSWIVLLGRVVLWQTNTCTTLQWYLSERSHTFWELKLLYKRRCWICFNINLTKLSDLRNIRTFFPFFRACEFECWKSESWKLKTGWGASFLGKVHYFYYNTCWHYLYKMNIECLWSRCLVM